MSEVCLAADIRGDERKFELYSRDRSQAYVLHVSDKRQYDYSLHK